MRARQAYEEDRTRGRLPNGSLEPPTCLDRCGCGRRDGDGAPSIRVQTSQQTIRFVPEADLKVLDPIWTTAYVTRNYSYLVYDTLFGTDENHQVKPQMVDRTTVAPDGMRYTFTLRDGLRWHDGKSVVAEDCVESLKRWGKIVLASFSSRTQRRSRLLIKKRSRSHSPTALAPSSKP
jgi:ABC-type transport system substrate-binding protein